MDKKLNKYIEKVKLTMFNYSFNEKPLGSD